MSFKQLLGVSNTQDFLDRVASIYKKSQEDPNIILFDNNIPKPANIELIQSIQEEIKTMKIGEFKNEDINLTDNTSLNMKLRESLDNIIPYAKSIENFNSITIMGNFIAKIMIWCNTYLESVPDIYELKVYFFGTPKRHELYFLSILADIGVTTTILTPTGQVADAPPNLHLEVETSGNSDNITLQDCVTKGVAVDKVVTVTKQASQELEQTLYNGSGIYKPWQYVNGTTKPVQLDSVIEDLLTYWDTEARMRPGFKTQDKIVTVPIFFTKIDGVNTNLNDYFKMVDQFRRAKHTMFYGSIGEFGAEIAKYLPVKNRLFSLAYCFNQEGKLDKEKLKQDELYLPLQSIRSDVQELIVSKVEETLNDMNKMQLIEPVTNTERVKLLAMAINLTESFTALIENFDFTSYIPKVIIYGVDVGCMDLQSVLFLLYLKQIGFDIVLLAPSGRQSIEHYIRPQFLNKIRLEEFVQNLALEPPKKESFLKRIFK